jgi:hypothetical protein
VTGYSESAETQNRITYNEETTRVDLASAAFSLPRFTISGTAPTGYIYNYENIAIPLKEVGVNVVVSKELIEESASSLSVEKMLVDLLTKKLTSEIERQIIVGRPVNAPAANRRECQGLFYYAIANGQIAMLVDLQQYVIAMHNEGVQVERLNEVAAATGQVVLRATVRVGGNLIDPKSYVQIVSN